MQARDRVFLVVILLAVWVGAVLVNTPEPLESEALIRLNPPEPTWPTLVPDFAAIDHTPDRKQAFVDFIRPMVDYHNLRLGAQRREILKWQRLLVQGVKLDAAQQQTMYHLAKHYRVAYDDVPPLEVVEALLRRVDLVPASMVLAQAATESGWGTSHFAVAGNNLFGIWCYQPGCGIVPRRRSPQAHHEVAAYVSPADSVGAYFHILNTHSAYRPFRDQREALRAARQPLSGLSLAAGLIRYSERGDEYVEQIRQMIRQNGFDALDDHEGLNPEASDRSHRG